MGEGFPQRSDCVAFARPVFHRTTSPLPEIMAARSKAGSGTKRSSSRTKDQKGKQSSATREGGGREVHLVVRLTRQEKQRVEDAAASVHLRVSDWVRQLVLTALDARR